MKYVYTEKDLDLISWERIDKFIEKIYSDVKKYLDENNYKIRYIAPILRGGGDTKIIYVSLTRDYTNRNSVKDACYTTWGMTTNETKEVSKEECERLGINYNFVSVYPWENIEEELFELNN